MCFLPPPFKSLYVWLISPSERYLLTNYSSECQTACKFIAIWEGKWLLNTMRLSGILGKCKIYLHTKRSVNPGDNQGRGPLVARAGKPAASQAPQLCSETECCRGIVVGKCLWFGFRAKMQGGDSLHNNSSECSILNGVLKVDLFFILVI